MNPLKAWNTFWFRPISARPLGVFRIVMGLVALGQLVLLTPDLDHWLTDQGVLQGDEAREIATPLRFSPLFYIQDPTSVRVFMAATAVVAVAVTVGWHTRVSAVVLYLMILSIHQRNILTNCGPDSLLMALIFYLMLCPSGAAYSLDARRQARRRGGTLAEPLIVPWAQRMIQVQLCMIYFATSVLKCKGTTWPNGTALHYVFMNVEVRRFDFEWLCQYPILINAMTYGALLIECGLAAFLWSRPTRRWIALAGVGLHGVITLTINVPLFGEMMTACYLLFLDPDELDALLRVFMPWTWFRKKAVVVLHVPGRLDGPEKLRGMHTSARAEGVEDRVDQEIGVG